MLVSPATQTPFPRERSGKGRQRQTNPGVCSVNGGVCDGCCQLPARFSVVALVAFSLDKLG